ALGPLTEPLEVLRAVADDVVLAGHGEDPTDLDPLEDLGDGVELLGGGEVGEVAGVDQEVGSSRQRVDPGHGLLERGGASLLVGVLAEPDMAVADLDEREAAGPGPAGALAERLRREDPAAGRPDESGAGPGHTLEEPAAVHAVGFVISDGRFFHGLGSVAETDGADRTRPRLRDDDSVRIMHHPETLARSTLRRGERSVARSGIRTTWHCGPE